MIWTRYTFAVLREGAQQIICVKYESCFTDKPIKVTHYWPTDREVWMQEELSPGGIFSGLVGAEATPQGTSSFSWRRGSYDWISFRLREDEKTKPIKTEESPVPPPKTRQQVRWYNGCWQRFYKSESKWRDDYTPFNPEGK